MEITKIEPLALPDGRQPTPLWPAWLTSRVSVLVENSQIDPQTGRWHDPVTLPDVLMLTAAQREQIEEHVRRLRSLLLVTPQTSEDAEKKTFLAITKLMLAKPARAGGPDAAEARGEAYTAALDDVPHWSVVAAIRKWYRGECGTDDRGRPFEYQWAPDSAVLRRMAMREVYEVRGRIHDLERTLAAVPFRDCTEEAKRGQAAMRGLFKSMADGTTEGLTFARAVEIGAALTALPSREPNVSRETHEAAE